MRLSLRFILPLVAVLVLIAYAVVPLVDKLIERWFVRDLDMRSAVIANSVREPLLEKLDSGSTVKIVSYFNRITQDERLFSIGFCDAASGTLIAAKTFPHELSCEGIASVKNGSARILRAHGRLHVAIEPIESEGLLKGRLVFVHDMSLYPAQER